MYLLYVDESGSIHDVNQHFFRSSLGGTSQQYDDNLYIRQ